MSTKEPIPASKKEHYVKAYVLLSGGLDSTTLLYYAASKYAHVKAVSVNYGQRHSKELTYAKASAAAVGAQHKIVDISPLMPSTMLTDSSIEIPDVSYDDLPHGISPTYVPFRNGLMLSLLASIAQGESVSHAEDPKDSVIFYGAHAEDSANWAYPDCTPEFNGAMANAIHIGTYMKTRLLTPLQYMQKSDIVKLGHELGVPFEMTWSCYKGTDMHCGTCPTCRSRRKAFIDANIPDPTQYLNDIDAEDNPF